MKNKAIFETFLIITLIASVLADDSLNTLLSQNGRIKGQLDDYETNEPLIGANVLVLDHPFGAATDQNGYFVIDDLPAGHYVLHFNYVGYEDFYMTDIIVRPQRTTFVQAQLKASMQATRTISVTAGFFKQKDEQPTSHISFTREEIRRAPGSAGDVSRIIMGLPSLAKINDQSNSLIVRGGSSIENAFYLDNIRIPNINHFPTHGSTGGPIGILNVDLIDEMEFMSGGYSAEFGGHLSSIMNIHLREGNRDQFNGQLDLNWAGLGGVFEGPFCDRKGSWIVSARRSYLDWVIKMFDVGTSLAPNYGDIQGKFVLDVAQNQQLSLLILFADSHSESTKEVADANAMTYYGPQDIYEFTSGINWRNVWPENGFSNTSFSVSHTAYQENYSETVSENLLLENLARETIFTLRNHNHFRITGNQSLQFGFELMSYLTDYENFYAEMIDPMGEVLPSFNMKRNLNSPKAGLFFNYRAKLFDLLHISLGLRTDYLWYNKQFHAAPRLSLSYQLNSRLAINASTGTYYQHLPLVLLAQNKKNKYLKDMKAIHYILGIDYLLTPSTKLTLEGYIKNYDHFALDPQQPGFFIIDEISYNHGFFTYHQSLIDKGRASAQGLELSLQKKLARDFYGMINASCFRSRYSDQEGVWRNRIYDNRLTFNLEGGYKPNSQWEFSVRWIYAGGPPYTPFDQAKSASQSRGILNDLRINQQRYNAYHSMNVRFDKRFHFQASNLVVFLSVWNVYDQKNIACYYWNGQTNTQEIIYQWRRLPIFGLEYEF